MKKFLLFLIFLASFKAMAADKIHLKALVDFNSSNPSEVFSAEVLETSVMGNIVLLEGDKINCNLLKIKDPKRAKIDAKVYFEIVSYENSRGVHEVSQNLIAKYAKKVLNKEEIKKIPPKKIAKTTAKYREEIRNILEQHLEKPHLSVKRKEYLNNKLSEIKKLR